MGAPTLDSISPAKSYPLRGSKNANVPSTQPTTSRSLFLHSNWTELIGAENSIFAISSQFDAVSEMYTFESEHPSARYRLPKEYDIVSTGLGNCISANTFQSMQFRIVTSPSSVEWANVMLGRDLLPLANATTSTMASFSPAADNFSCCPSLIDISTMSSTS